MPKMMCKCGEVLSYSDIPCKIEYKFISDVEYDKFQGNVDSEELYDEMKSFLLCPKCNRLWFFYNEIFLRNIFLDNIRSISRGIICITRAYYKIHEAK